MSEVVAVAKKKPKSPPRAGTANLGVRISREYAEWVAELAAWNRSTISGLIDQALLRYAKAIEFPKPPPER